MMVGDDFLLSYGAQQSGGNRSIRSVGCERSERAWYEGTSPVPSAALALLLDGLAPSLTQARSSGSGVF